MKLKYRQLQKHDIGLVKTLYQNETVMRYISEVKTGEETQVLMDMMLGEISRGSAKYFVIECCSTDSDWRLLARHFTAAGIFSMHWNERTKNIKLGIMLLPDFQRRGIFKKVHLEKISEAQRLYPVNKFIAWTDQANYAANLSYKRLGFELNKEVSLVNKRSVNQWEIDSFFAKTDLV